MTAKEGDSYGSAGAVAEEVFSNIRTVIAYGGEQKEVERYSIRIKDVFYILDFILKLLYCLLYLKKCTEYDKF